MILGGPTCEVQRRYEWRPSIVQRAGWCATREYAILWPQEMHTILLYTLPIFRLVSPEVYHNGDGAVSVKDQQTSREPTDV